MDEKTKGLVDLMNEALRLAEERLRLNQTKGKPKDEPLGALETIIRALEYRREQALNGELGLSQGYITLGVSREILDWDKYDSPLARAVGSIERYYLEVYK